MINKIFCDDYKLIRTFENNSVDTIIIDPPYGIEYNNLKWDSKNSVDFDLIFRESYRLLKLTGNLIIFYGWSNICELLQKNNYFKLKNWIIWDRQKTKNGGNKNFTSAREDILWFTKSNNYVFNKEDSIIKKKTKGFGSKNGSEYRRLSNVWIDISPIMYKSIEYSGYPCQKPLQLMRRLVRTFSNENDTILDFFCGSGSTLEACKIENRNFIGIDNNEEAIKIVKDRLKSI